jgi:hypothetical protein
MEKVCAMLHDSDLLKFLWAEVTAHAVYLKTRTWTRAIGNTMPYEILYGCKLDVGNLHLWGCKVRVHNPGGSKLDSRSSVGRWMGFDAETKDGHRIYWPEKRMVSVERSVKFNFPPEEVIIGILPLEGERNDNERLMAIEPERREVITEPSDVEETQVIPEVEEGRGKHI